MRKMTEDQVFELAQLAALRQPKVLVSTELLKAIEETLALYGERLEASRQSLASMMLTRWTP